MEIETATSALAALGQANRLAVFRALVEAGPEGRLPSELADALQLPAATLSFHLKTLHDAGLVRREAQGRQLRYRADFEAMNGLVAFLTDNCCGGRPELCAPMTACCPVAPETEVTGAFARKTRER